MSIKINSLELENVKRIKAVKLEPTSSGLTIVGGNNNQGKTSVLDAIAWALGGNKYKPAHAERDGSTIPPVLKVELSNGLIVERKGKNSTLKVTDPSGQMSGQKLLDEFIEELALNLPKFINSTPKEKATTLLQIIGVEDQLIKLEHEESELYNERLQVGRISDQKSKFAKEMTFYEGMPKEPVSPNDLIKQQQEILARNGENQRKREQVGPIEFRLKTAQGRFAMANDRIDSLSKQLEEATAERTRAGEDIDKLNLELLIARKTAEQLVDESTAELENNLRDIETINICVRANLDRERAEIEAENYQNEYEGLTTKIEDIRAAKTKLLADANLPLEGLSVSNGELIYKNQPWDNMSGSDQLKVATAIVRKLNPECGFVLMDKLEQMDLDTLVEFNDWLIKEQLQVIATRVSKGDECSIVIEDGYVKNATVPLVEETKIDEVPKWKAGQF